MSLIFPPLCLCVCVQVLLTSSNSYSQGRLTSTLGAYLTSHTHHFTPTPPTTMQHNTHITQDDKAAANETFYLFGNHHGTSPHASLGTHTHTQRPFYASPLSSTLPNDSPHLYV